MPPVTFTASSPLPGLVVEVAHGQVVVHDPGDVGQDVDACSRRSHHPFHVLLLGDVGRHQLSE